MKRKFKFLRIFAMALMTAFALAANAETAKPNGEMKTVLDELQAKKGHGVTASYRNFNSVTHEFFGMAPVLQEAKEAQKFVVMELKKSFQ